MNPHERSVLLHEYFSLDGAQTQKAVDRRAELRQAYESGLPRVSFSRCPFTGQVFTHSLDTGGLDGLWWQHALPIRAVVEDLPDTYFALTGAVKLGGKVERAPFRSLPGPEAPFVVRRMLLHEDVKAVVSQVRIGDHVGYPVVYFASPMPPLLQRFNEWGANLYTYESETLGDAWDDIVEEDEQLDFNLAGWIASGDLFWIAPDDDKLVLRATAAGCPYLDLDGRRTWAAIENGTVEELGHPAPAKKTAARKTAARKTAAKKTAATKTAATKTAATKTAAKKAPSARRR